MTWARREIVVLHEDVNRMQRDIAELTARLPARPALSHRNAVGPFETVADGTVH
jgi:hypothetical protein